MFLEEGQENRSPKTVVMSKDRGHDPVYLLYLQKNDDW